MGIRAIRDDPRARMSATRNHRVRSVFRQTEAGHRFLQFNGQHRKSTDCVGGLGGSLVGLAGDFLDRVHDAVDGGGLLGLPLGRFGDYLCPGDLPVTEKSYLELLSLPLFPGLGEADQGRVIDVVQDAFERLAR